MKFLWLAPLLLLLLLAGCDAQQPRQMMARPTPIKKSKRVSSGTSLSSPRAKIGQ